MKFIITIDTEEDNWSNYHQTDNPTENIQYIPELQELFDKYEVKPTYLVTYPVATNPKSVDILKRILEQGKCEIGMHCHPWNTPPFEGYGPIRKQDTMLCNLDQDLVHNKLSHLHEKIQKNFGITPTSFRAGRYGFSNAVAKSLIDLGYCADSSVTPFVSWKDYYGPDFSSFRPSPFRFSDGGLEQHAENGPLLEVPVTIGFLQKDFEASQQMLKSLDRPLFKRMHAAGILERLRLLNKVWLSPELSRSGDMIKLIKKMEKNKYPLVNLTFHSTSLQMGLSPFVKTDVDKANFMKKIQNLISYVYYADWESKVLAEC